MRWVAILTALSLTACAGNEDLGKKFSGAVSAFAAGIDSDTGLEFDLKQDFRRKSEELEFISLNSYTCGDPSDPYVRIARKTKLQTAKDKDKVKKDARKALDKKIGQIKIIVGYGEAVAAISTRGGDFETATSKMRDGITTVAGLVPSVETAAFSFAATSLISIAQNIDLASRNALIVAVALRINPHLKKMAADLKKGKNLKIMSEDEEEAYALWDACALERLQFIRDYFYPVLKSGLSADEISKARTGHRLEGMTKTSVMDFASAYAAYITEREQFLARKTDYESLIDDIVKANQEIIDNRGVGVAFDTINNLGTAASKLNAQSEKLRKSGALHKLL